MRLIGLLILLVLGALPIYFGAKQYCKTGSKFQLYGIVYGGQILFAILVALVVVALVGDNSSTKSDTDSQDNAANTPIPV